MTKNKINIIASKNLNMGQNYLYALVKNGNISLQFAMNILNN